MTARMLIAAVVLLAAPAAALAADATVPANAAGVMKDWAGEPWLEPLASCTALWTVAARNAAPAEQGRYNSSAVAFRLPAAERVEKDRGVPFERAQAIVQQRARTYEFMERSSTPEETLTKAKACDAVLAAYRAAFP